MSKLPARLLMNAMRPVSPGKAARPAPVVAASAARARTTTALASAVGVNERRMMCSFVVDVATVAPRPLRDSQCGLYEGKIPCMEEGLRFRVLGRVAADRGGASVELGR